MRQLAPAFFYRVYHPELDGKNESLARIFARVEYVEEQQGDMDICIMAEMFGCFVNKVERVVKQYLGLTAKSCGMMRIRFRKSVLSDEPRALFYNQSHFSKSCKKFTLKLP